MSDFSERDRQLLAIFVMTEEQVREAEMIAESETIPDGLVGRSTTGVTMMLLLSLVYDRIFSEFSVFL